MISLISLLLLTPSISVNDVADPVSAGADPGPDTTLEATLSQDSKHGWELETLRVCVFFLGLASRTRKKICVCAATFHDVARLYRQFPFLVEKVLAYLLSECEGCTQCDEQIGTCDFSTSACVEKTLISVCAT